MLVVGGVVLRRVCVVPSMNMAMTCVYLKRRGKGPRPMGRRKARRNDSQRKNQRKRRDQSDYALPGIVVCPALSHTLPVVLVALSPWGG